LPFPLGTLKGIKGKVGMGVRGFVAAHFAPFCFGAGVARGQVTFLAPPRKVTERRRPHYAALRVPSFSPGYWGQVTSAKVCLSPQGDFFRRPIAGRK
jgi:hypothetical protein